MVCGHYKRWHKKGEIIMRQQENTKQLFRLIEENPTLRILPLVDTECVPSDDYNSWIAQWGTARIEEIWEDNNYERIFQKSYDFDDLVLKVMDEDEYDLNEEEARKIVNNFTWEKVIVVKIHP